MARTRFNMDTTRFSLTVKVAQVWRGRDMVGYAVWVDTEVNGVKEFREVPCLSERTAEDYAKEVVEYYMSGLKAEAKSDAPVEDKLDDLPYIPFDDAGDIKTVKVKSGKPKQAKTQDAPAPQDATSMMKEMAAGIE